MVAFTPLPLLTLLVAALGQAAAQTNTPASTASHVPLLVPVVPDTWVAAPTTEGPLSNNIYGAYCTKARGNFSVDALTKAYTAFCHGGFAHTSFHGSVGVGDGWFLTYGPGDGYADEWYCGEGYRWIVERCAAYGKGGAFTANAVTFRLTRGPPRTDRCRTSGKMQGSTELMDCSEWDYNWFDSHKSAA
ncbi:uncharacterized protein LOC62_02G003336 [Vanrija pseudolonga]|uniref:Uncharacterized protein n=1 Tax=Vanrija pseudolonga TaxID=143232 RepID=A0AAF0Y8D2_9TREE|nr:hypothetical protein LOC62_02G003336 [Vanrija pseudolonga]